MLELHEKIIFSPTIACPRCNTPGAFKLSSWVAKTDKDRVAHGVVAVCCDCGCRISLTQKEEKL